MRKGVYMDGHERPDIVEYCNQTFLPLMGEYQKRMAKWELQGSKLVRTGPKLGSDETQIIVLSRMRAASMQMSIKEQYGAYHCSYFPGNALIILERKKSGEQKLMKKGRGQLIHVSDFVEEENR